MESIQRKASKARYELTDKGRARKARYVGSAKGMLADLRHEAKRRGNR